MWNNMMGAPQMDQMGQAMQGAVGQWGRMSGTRSAMPGFGGFGQYQPQATGADQGNARIDKLKGRVSNLQEQMKGAGTQDMAGIQARMDKMRGRIKGLRQDRRQGEGMYGQPAGQQGGAQPEPGMMQTQGPMSFGGNTGVAGPWGAQGQYGGGQGMYGQMNGGMYGGGQMGGAAPWGGGMNFGGMQGGGMGGMGGMPWGAPNMGQYRAQMEPAMYNPGANQGGAAPQGANRPGMQYRQDRRQARRQGGAQPEPGQMPQQQQAPQQGGGWNPGTTPTSMGNMFDTGWGRLVASSTGNQNVMQLENDPSRLFHYDPNAQNGPGAKNGWKSMTPDEYRSYGDVNYADPRAFGAAASPMMQQWTQKNGMWQGMQGSGAYA